MAIVFQQCIKPHGTGFAVQVNFCTARSNPWQRDKPVVGQTQPAQIPSTQGNKTVFRVQA